MSGICNQNRFSFIRLYIQYNLIFFVASWLTACHSPDNTGITIRWDDKRAVGLSIPRQLTASITADSVPQLLSVRLANKETAILGDIKQTGDDIVFEPLVPFTRGLRYTVWLRNKALGTITIPALASDDKPVLLGIYPSQDSVPENLLKVYLQFSRPMREGQSQKYVTLLKNKTDTLTGVFLDLQPELWNPDRTLLTLWLDPGRIKRDLQPNKRLGTPLQLNNQYQLLVSAAWPDAQGATLGQAMTKSFLTVPRDSLSPVPASWAIRAPKSGGMELLEVAFGEALDYSLLTATLTIVDEQGRSVSGKWQPGEEEKSGLFKPDKPWQAGPYRLHVESRLEDLAGNNLNRLFDRDITRKNSAAPTQAFRERYFQVE